MREWKKKMFVTRGGNSNALPLVEPPGLPPTLLVGVVLVAPAGLLIGGGGGGVCMTSLYISPSEQKQQQ
jgi:hypothetical protein